VQDALAARGRDDVLMVSFSVTPRIDTPAALSAFGAARGVDARRWRLLTTLDGSADPIERVMRESYFASDDRGRLLHTERVVLVDAAGRLRGVYNGTQRFEMERLVEDVDALAGSDRAR
jgi:protein SCO1/2